MIESKKLIFSEPGQVFDFVVFPEHPDQPFWRNGETIRHVSNGASLEGACFLAECGVMRRREILGPETFEDYQKAAESPRARRVSLN